MKELAPNLETIDPNLSGFHCLFCRYTDPEVHNVLLHCALNHCDSDICVYNKFQSIQSFNERSNSVHYIDDNDCDSNESNHTNRVLSKPSPQKIETLSNEDIPGLEHNFRPPLKQRSYEPFFEDNYEPMDFSDPEEYSQSRQQDNRLQWNQRTNSQIQSNYEPNRYNRKDYNPPNDRQNETFKRSSSYSDLSAKRSRNQTSTPISHNTPPVIDLEDFDPEIRSQSNSSTTSSDTPNKQKKSIGFFRNKTQNDSQKSNTNSPQNQKKVSKPNKISYIERNEEEEDDEYIRLINESEARKHKRGVNAIIEKRSFFEPTAIPKTRIDFNEKNIFKCLICNIDNLRNNKIELHLEGVHKTTSSFKCGYCNFIGHKTHIRDHLKQKHPTAAEEKIEKFIVPKGQNTAIGLSSFSRFERPLQRMTARKRTNPTKGSLIQQMSSTFMGPLRNDKTEKKKLSEMQESNSRALPFIRVRNQTKHSSDIKPKKTPKPVHNQVAKKSTSNRINANSENDSQIIIDLTDRELRNKYFCLFCTNSFLINNKLEAIEHYKTHLNLGYTCTKCQYSVINYDQMQKHMISVHKNKQIDFVDNMSEEMTNWISDFLDNQKANAVVIDINASANSNEINMKCPLCVKASVISRGKAKSFQALWQLKLHFCKHLHWMSMKCRECLKNQMITMFPNSPYLLMKHLVDSHFTEENLFHRMFRGQQAYNDIKPIQLNAIKKYFEPLKVTSSDKLNAFFSQIMDEFDMMYENQLKSKFGIKNEIEIPVNRLSAVQIKNEPIDETDLNDNERLNNHNDSEDKKDIKPLVKTEIKIELKTEIKDEVKNEVKQELKPHENYFKRLYGDDNASTSTHFHPISSDEVIILSSDDES
jgi:hypothetical protein